MALAFWLSPFRGWDRLTMAFTGKLVYLYVYKCIYLNRIKMHKTMETEFLETLVLAIKIDIFGFHYKQYASD